MDEKVVRCNAGGIKKEVQIYSTAFSQCHPPDEPGQVDEQRGQRIQSHGRVVRSGRYLVLARRGQIDVPLSSRGVAAEHLTHLLQGNHHFLPSERSFNQLRKLGASIGYVYLSHGVPSKAATIDQRRLGMDLDHSSPHSDRIDSMYARVAGACPLHGPNASAEPAPERRRDTKAYIASRITFSSVVRSALAISATRAWSSSVRSIRRRFMFPHRFEVRAHSFPLRLIKIELPCSIRVNTTKPCL